MSILAFQWISNSTCSSKIIPNYLTHFLSFPHTFFRPTLRISLSYFVSSNGSPLSSANSFSTLFALSINSSAPLSSPSDSSILVPFSFQSYILRCMSYTYDGRSMSTPSSHLILYSIYSLMLFDPFFPIPMSEWRFRSSRWHPKSHKLRCLPIPCIFPPFWLP